jgi:hypothetical protein
VETTPPSGRWTAGRVAAVVIGSILTLVGVAVLVAGCTGVWADQTQRDQDGYLSTPREPFHTPTYAMTTKSLDLVKSDTPDWLVSKRVLGKVRLQARSQRPLFLGIAPTGRVQAYLGRVRHDVITDVSYDPFSYDVRRIAGGAPAAPPGKERFWDKSSSGRGTVDLVWNVRHGKWTVVVMNADASPSVTARMSAGAKLRFLLWLSVGLLLGGALLIVGGALLIYAGARTRPAAAAVAVGGAAAPAAAEGAAATVYPVAVRADLDRALSRWLWLVKWLLLIPHFIVLAFLWIAFGVLTVVAGFAILFTGRYPRGIFDFNVGVLRWTWRVMFYGYWALATDRYPPFTLAEVPGYPASLEVAYPARLSRWRWLVKWLLAIPHLVLVAVFVGVWGFGWAPFGSEVRGPGIAGLVGILTLVAGIVMLFTGRYPPAIFEFITGLDRWVLRVAAYVSLMRDEYPPFRLDMGPREPAELPAAPAPGPAQSAEP